MTTTVKTNNNEKAIHVDDDTKQSASLEKTALPAPITTKERIADPPPPTNTTSTVLNSSTDSKKSPEETSVKLTRTNAIMHQHEQQKQEKPIQKKKATHFGKADPIRDFIILILFFIIFMLLSFTLDPALKPTKDNTTTNITTRTKKSFQEKLTKHVHTLSNNVSTAMTNGANTINRVVDTNARILFQQMKSTFQYKRVEHCPLYYDTTSIAPYNTYTIYAGQNYTINDPILMIHSGNTYSSTKTSYYYYQFLIKHHPTLANVREVVIQNNDENSTKTVVSLVATRNIKAGDELIMEYKQHMHSQLNKNKKRREYNNNNIQDSTTVQQQEQHVQSYLDETIPLYKDYILADTILNDTLNVLDGKLKSFYKKGEKGIPKRYQIVRTDFVYGLLRTVLKRFSPMISSLLPRSTKEINKRQMFTKQQDSTHLHVSLAASIYASIQNKTIDEIQTSGTCITDIQYYTTIDTNKAGVVAALDVEETKSDRSDSNDSLTTNNRLVVLMNRNIVKKGMIIAKIPLWIVVVPKSKHGKPPTGPTTTNDATTTTCPSSTSSSNLDPNNTCSSPFRTSASFDDNPNNQNCFEYENDHRSVTFCPFAIATTTTTTYSTIDETATAAAVLSIPTITATAATTTSSVVQKQQPNVEYCLDRNQDEDFIVKILATNRNEMNITTMPSRRRTSTSNDNEDDEERDETEEEVDDDGDNHYEEVTNPSSKEGTTTSQIVWINVQALTDIAMGDELLAKRSIQDFVASHISA